MDLIYLLIHSSGVLLGIVLSGTALYLVRRLRSKIPTLHLDELLELARRVEDCQYRVSDLVERFNRFQRRTGMREARDATQRNQELELEALEHVRSAAAPAPPVPTKEDLRRDLLLRGRRRLS